MRICEDAELLETLGRYSTPEKRIYAMVHFNHPRELTPEAYRCLDALHRAGLALSNQTPILKGINDDSEVLAELMRRLARWGSRLRIAIERPSGLIVDALVEAGHEVFPIHPNAVKASRPRYRSHGAKSDASDAYLLADLLRTDGHRWRELSPQSDSIRALRALVRSRDDLVATRVQLANQLRSLLQSFWPGATEVFADVDSPIGLAFILRYPTPESASRLGPKRMAAFCAQHAYSGRRGAAELLDRLHQARQGVGYGVDVRAD
jgi:hypothetical protein